MFNFKVTWMKNKELLDDTELYHFENYEDTYCFEIKDTEKEDAGVYLCAAENTEGRASVEIPLVVKGTFFSYLQILQCVILDSCFR